MLRVIRRAVRWVSYVVVLSILSSALPPATAQNLAPAPPPPVAGSPPLPIAGDAASVPAQASVIPRPTAAQSTYLAPSVVTQLRQQYDRRHVLGGYAFDGTFSTLQAQTYADAGAYMLSGPNEVSKTVVLPAGIVRDSALIDVSLTSKSIYGAKASVAVRSLGDTSPWPLDGGAQVLTAPPTSGGNITVTASISLTLGSSVPFTTPMEIQLLCSSNVQASVDCTWSNIRVFQDVAGWQTFFTSINDVNPPTTIGSTDWWIARVTAGAFDDIPVTPERGAFFAVRAREAGFGARYNSSIIYRFMTPVTLPTLQDTDILNTSLWWARTFSDATPELSGVSGDGRILFRPNDTTSPIVLATIPATNTLSATPWTALTMRANPQTGGLSRVSGKTGWIEIQKRLGSTDHTLALDSLTFTLNGQSLSFGGLPATVPPDQVAGKCICDAGGRIQRIDFDPVNTASGTFLHRATDLAVASGGPPLTLERTYTSLFTTSGYPVTALGPGWRHSFAHALTLPTQPGGEAGKVIYEAPTGNRLRFTDPGGDVTLTPFPGVRATLTRSGGGYTLTLRDQATMRFDAQGRLTEQRDPEQRRQTLSYYTGTGQVWDGQLQTVTDVATGWTLTLSYQNTGGQPRLREVRDSSNRFVTYTYTTQGDLFEVTDLRG
jgi:YD repeat-containing protein